MPRQRDVQAAIRAILGPTWTELDPDHAKSPNWWALAVAGAGLDRYLAARPGEAQRTVIYHGSNDEIPF